MAKRATSSASKRSEVSTVLPATTTQTADTSAGEAKTAAETLISEASVAETHVTVGTSGQPTDAPDTPPEAAITSTSETVTETAPGQTTFNGGATETDRAALEAAVRSISQTDYAVLPDPITLDFTSTAGKAPINPLTAGMVVRVTGPKKGRWRAGRHFTRAAVDIPLDELTEAECQAIAEDPALKVEVVPASD